MSVLVFIISLPLAVITISSLFGVWDNRFSSNSVVRLIVRLSVVCLFLILIPNEHRMFFMIAAAVVIGLHATSYVAVRVLLLMGVVTEKDDWL